MESRHGRQNCQNGEDVARIVWAAHILFYLTNNRNHAKIPDEAEDAEDGDDIDEPSDCETDCETEKAVILSGPLESVRRKFLDCIAQLFSHCKGWDGVTATAMREREDGVEVDIALNNGFSSDIKVMEYCRALERYLAASIEDTNIPVDSSTEFEQRSVDYMSRRVDEWIEDLQRVLRSRKKSMATNRQHEREAASEWATMMELILQFDADNADSESRLRVVKQAYRCVNISQIQALLSDTFGVQGGQKLWGSMNFIARPLVDAQLLRSIAVREPQFRNCRLSLVPRKPKTTFDARYMVGIFEAWERLGLGSIPESLVSKLRPYNQRFKRACVKPFSLHAEMQILLHYDEGCASQPTLNYFGCSKKSCLLCETFLAAWPNPIHTRGRHGICYPSWGMPFSKSVPMQDAIKTLSRSLVARIRGLLKNGMHKSQANNVMQSDLVSQLSDLTLEEWQQREQSVRQYENNQMELQKDTQLKQGIAPTTTSKHRPSQNFESENCCVMCNTSPGHPCPVCRSTYYCSDQCAKSDTSSHQILCEQFAMQTDRPSPRHKRAIFFPADREKPSLIWISCTREYDPEGRISWTRINPYPYLGTDDPPKKHLRIEHNPVRSRNLGSGFAAFSPSKEGYCVSLLYRVAYLKDGSSTNRSIQASIAASGPSITPHEYRGPMIALRELHHEDYDDITLADFRHLMDYLVSYLDTKVKETVPGLHHRAPTTIRGVKICCYGEIKLHGSHPFVAVDVTRSNQIALGDGSISPIAVRLGMPLRLWKDPDPEFRVDPPGWEDGMTPDSNQNVAFLMMETDASKDAWGWAPMEWNIDIGNVWAVRADGKDLSMDDAAMMCHFARRKLQPMFGGVRESSNSLASRRKVVDFITWDNMVAHWKATGRR